MDLTGSLSNHEVSSALQRLTERDWKQDDRRRGLPRGLAPDGRRKFGTVRDAIVAVLEDAGHELRVRDIHGGVERLLGEPVSRSSVNTYLNRDCQRRTSLFEYRGKKGYQLVR